MNEKPSFQAPDRDMIVARATPPGAGGVAVIRVSGRGCREAAGRLFRSSRPDFEGLRPYRLHHGHLLSPDGRPVDEVLAAFMPGPGSYTGEDTVEISCHGGPAVVAGIIAAFTALGARLARPGEFTKRAFVNGRLDLSQAEAVAELIAARTRTQADMALARLDGAMGDRARKLRASLETLRAGVCLAVDFPEDEVECLSREDFAAGVKDVACRIRDLIAAHDRARPWREGASVALFGRVNAGKSRLFNALLGRERAIVTDVPGTTRDYLEETLDIDGMPVRLVDTAGLRETADQAERAGRDRGAELTGRADLALFVVDGSVALPERPTADGIDELAVAERLGPSRVLAVINKADLEPGAPDPGQVLAGEGFAAIRVSAKTGRGLDELVALIRDRLTTGGPPDDATVPSLREASALAAALSELTALSRDIEAGVPYDLLGLRLEAACAELSGITGETTPDEILRSIFDRFCIGK